MTFDTLTRQAFSIHYEEDTYSVPPVYCATLDRWRVKMSQNQLEFVFFWSTNEHYGDYGVYVKFQTDDFPYFPWKCCLREAKFDSRDIILTEMNCKLFCPV